MSPQPKKKIENVKDSTKENTGTHTKEEPAQNSSGGGGMIGEADPREGRDGGMSSEQ